MTAAVLKGPPVTGYSLAFATPLAGFFVLFFLAPLLLLVVISFYATPELQSFGFDQYVKIATDGFTLPVLFDTLWLGLQTTLLCLLLGYALAWCYVRSPGSLQKLLMLAAKVSRQPATIPGSVRGKVILTKVRSALAPSADEASCRFGSSFCKAVMSGSTISGSCTLASVTIRPPRV